MKNQYHILNGDALKERFPENIQGKIIVARECLVDGDVSGNSLTELFQTRAKFLSQNYGGTEEEYYKETVTEFDKISKIENDGIINLWFEDDLFCQVNFWFLVNLIFENQKQEVIYLIRPKQGCEYSFAKMTNKELSVALQEKIEIEFDELKEISKLWKFYQSNEFDKMLEVAKTLGSKYHFLIPAINAHKDRSKINGNLGRPKKSLIQIMKELDTKDFVPVFKEFCKREEIYGFGDLQVKRLFDELPK